MGDLNNDIKKAKEIISNCNYYTSTFNYDSYIYRFTNEPISKYQKYLKDREKVLSVTASGDQIFNSILFGSKTIDSFDISRFPKYFFELKKSALLSLSRDDFLEFFTCTNYDFNLNCFKEKNNSQLSEMYSGFKSLMDAEYRGFWDEIFKWWSIRDVLRSRLFSPEECDFCTLLDLNPYIEEDNYEELKKKIKDVDIKHHVGDIKKIVDSFKEEYDLINLSNILTYTNLLEYKKLLNNLSLTDDGVVISYLPFPKEGIRDIFYQDEYTFDYYDESKRNYSMIYQKKKTVYKRYFLWNRN